jgi:hypothetical protein
MRFLAMTGCAYVLAAVFAISTASATENGASSRPLIQLAQNDSGKKETVTHKVERKVKSAWRSMTGYKFNVACLTGNTTCTETGKDKSEARGKCIAAHPLCVTSDTD